MFRLVLTGSLALLLHVLTKYLTRRAKQAHLRTLPGPPSPSFWSGVSKNLHSPFAVPYREHVLAAYGRVIILPGFLGEAQLAVSDTLALSAMFGKYRDVFELPDWMSMTHNVVFGPGLLSVSGRDHYRHRRHLNPAFSPKHLRNVVSTLSSVAQELVDVLRDEVTGATTEVEVAEFLSRYSLESVGRTTLGYSFGPLKRHGTDYSRALKEFGPTLGQLQLWRPLLPTLTKFFPRRLLRIGATLLPWNALHHMQSISDSVYAMSKRVLNKKIELIKAGGDALIHEVGEGNDLMSVLLKEHMSSNDVDSLSELDLLGQMSQLLLAATDTTSTSLSRAIQLLAERPEIQDRLRQELIDATRGTGRTLRDLDYDAFATLPYLDAVIRETIRKYPAFYILQRSAEEDVVLPLGSPITSKDGKQISELLVPAGTLVWINVFGVNRDPELWGPDANDWKPERWLAPLPEKVLEAHIPSVFSHTLTFAAGPRSCIGYNLALTEMRIALAHLITSFEFTPSDKEIVWKLGGIISPSVKGSTVRKPELPVKMTPLKT